MFRVLFLCSTSTLRLGNKLNLEEVAAEQRIQSNIGKEDRQNYGMEFQDGKFIHKLRGIPGRIFSKMRDM